MFKIRNGLPAFFSAENGIPPTNCDEPERTIRPNHQPTQIYELRVHPELPIPELLNQRSVSFGRAHTVTPLSSTAPGHRRK